LIDYLGFDGAIQMDIGHMIPVGVIQTA